MLKLDPSEYEKVIPLIRNQNELSVFSVLHRVLPGEVFTDDAQAPQNALIMTSECNYLAGSAENETFLHEIGENIEFWDQVTPDHVAWHPKIPEAHPNKMIREYTRRRYQVTPATFHAAKNMPEDEFVIENVDLFSKEASNYQNINSIYEWAESFGTKQNFMDTGVGCFIRKGDQLISWSLTDCVDGAKAAIGVHTKEAFRKMGFGYAVVSATIESCFQKGYETVEWLCVDSNKGSIAIAERCGFQLVNTYSSFSSFPPVENIFDYSEADWLDWAEYYAQRTQIEPRLFMEQLYAYAKANDVVHVKATLREILDRRTEEPYATVAAEDPGFKNFIGQIHYLQSIGICQAFSLKEWSDFVEGNLRV